MSKKKQLTLGPIEHLTRLSYSTLFLIWVSWAAIFGVLYFILSVYIPWHGPNIPEGMPVIQKFSDSIYYSIITATSTGYGDITPQGFSKVLASVQSMIALLVFAVFVTKLVSHKQEIALKEVHRLSFEDIFHNTREGLYIIRKDCERIMKEAEEKKELTSEDWKDLIIIYRMTQSLMQEIPDFYANDEELEQRGLYTIDIRREQLLHEAVHRTLHRINQMLDALSKAGIDWVSEEESVKELRELVNIVSIITPVWEKESPYTEVFEDLLHVNDSIHKRIESALPYKEDDE